MNRWPREPMDLDFASLDPSGPPPPHALPAFSSSHPALPFTLLPLLLRVSCRPPRSFRGSWFSCGAREPDGGPGPDGRRRGSAIIIQTIFCRDLRGSNLERSVGSTAPVFLVRSCCVSDLFVARIESELVIGIFFRAKSA